jgi:hypothetical protein
MIQLNHVIAFLDTLPGDIHASDRYLYWYKWPCGVKYTLRLAPSTDF